MSYREVIVIEIREILRLWLRDEMGQRKIADAVGCDRKTSAGTSRPPRTRGWCATVTSVS